MFKESFFTYTVPNNLYSLNLLANLGELLKNTWVSFEEKVNTFSKLNFLYGKDEPLIQWVCPHNMFKIDVSIRTSNEYDLLASDIILGFNISYVPNSKVSEKDGLEWFEVTAERLEVDICDFFGQKFADLKSRGIVRIIDEDSF